MLTVASLPELWQIVADSFSGRTTALVDPPIFTNDWEINQPVPVVGSDIVVTLSPKIGDDFEIECPAPLTTWAGLKATMNDARWRRAIFASGPTMDPGQTFAHDLLTQTRSFIREELWGELTEWHSYFIYDEQFATDYLSPFGATVRTEIAFWAKAPTMLTEVHPTTFADDFQVAVDICGAWELRWTNFGAPFWSYPEHPDMQDELSTVWQFAGYGDSANHESIDALHTLAERVARAQGGGSVSDGKGRLLGAVTGDNVALPVRVWSIDSALRRLSMALKNWLHADMTIVNQKTGAVFCPRDGMLIPGKGRR